MTDARLIRRLWLTGGFGALLLVLSLIGLFTSCSNENPFEKRVFYDDVGMKFSISTLNDSLNAYCNHPITFQITIDENKLDNIDSVLLRPSDFEAFRRFDDTYSMDIVYPTDGQHKVTVRTYFVKDGGLFVDTSFVVRTRFYNLNIPFSVTPERSDTARFNTYCFFPVTFKAFPREADMEYIDSLLLYVNNNPINLNIANNYTAMFEYADTGTHTLRMRRYQSKLVDNTPYRDTSTTVVVGVDFRGGAVDVELDDNGSNVLLKALGQKNDGVAWYWNLYNVLGTNTGVRVLGDTSVFVNRSFDGVVSLSQIKGDKNTVSVSVPFRTRFHQNSSVPYSIAPSRDGNGYNAYVFMPITFTAAPKSDDAEHLDSLVVFVDSVRNAKSYRLTKENKYSVSFNYADTGIHVLVFRIYDAKNFGAPYYREFKESVSIGADFDLRNKNFEVGTGQNSVTLRVSGTYPDGILWNWDLSDIGFGKKNRAADSVVIGLNGGSIIKGGVYLQMCRLDTVGGAVVERVSTKKGFDVIISGKYHTFTVVSNTGNYRSSVPVSGYSFLDGSSFNIRLDIDKKCKYSFNEGINIQSISVDNNSYAEFKVIEAKSNIVLTIRD